MQPAMYVVAGTSVVVLVDIRLPLTPEGISTIMILMKRQEHIQSGTNCIMIKFFFFQKVLMWQQVKELMVLATGKRYMHVTKLNRSTISTITQEIIMGPQRTAICRGTGQFKLRVSARIFPMQGEYKD